MQIAQNLNLKKLTGENLIYYKKKMHTRKSGPKLKINKADTLSIKIPTANETISGCVVTCNKIFQSQN